MNYAKMSQIVTEHTDAMLAYWDADEICRYANYAYVKWFNKTPEEMINKITLKQLLGPIYNLNQPYIENVLKGKTQVFYRDIVLPTGELKHAIATYHPDNEGGIIKGFFVHVADMGAPTLNLTEFEKLQQAEFNVAEKNQPGADKFVDNRMLELASYLRSQIFSEFPGLLKLSKKFGLSLAKLKRDFKRIYEITPLNYFRKQQMIYANQQLKRKNTSRKELAALLNFSNPSNFSNQFKRFIEDIKEQKSNTSNNQLHQKLYQAYLNVTPFAVAIVDENLNYLMTSREWQKVYHQQEREIAGEPFIMIPELHEHFISIMNTCLQHNIHSNEEYCYRAHDGSMHAIKWDIRPWNIAEENIAGLIVFTEDITDKLRK